LNEGERKIVLVVIRISADRLPENLFSPGRVTKTRVDVPEQSQEGIILLARRRDLPRGFKRLGIKAFAEVSIGQIEFHVVGIGICVQRHLEMLDGVVVQTVPSEQYTRAGWGALVTRT
jgi:hypothetical protein